MNAIRNFRPSPYLFIFCFFVGVLGTAIYEHWQYEALAFNAIQIEEFLQFAVHGLDFSHPHNLVVNTDGSNMFLQLGPAAGRNFYTYVHPEFIKVVAAVLYALIPSPVFLLALFILAYFSSWLYGAFLTYKNRERGPPLFLALLAITLFPLTPNYAAGLSYPESFTLIIPLTTLFLCSLIYRRGLRESLLFLNLLFLLGREESMIFAFGGILYLWLREYYEKQPHRESWYLTLNWLLWVAIIAAYIIWAGNPFSSGTAAPLLILEHSLIAWIGLLLIACVLYFIWRFRRHQFFATYAGSIVFALITLLPVAFAFAMDELYFHSPIVAVRSYNRYGYSPFAIVTLVYLLLAQGAAQKNKRPLNIGAGLLGICICAFALIDFLPHPSSVTSQIVRYHEEAPDAALVFAAARELPPQAPVLLSFETAYPFYLDENAMVYGSLPYRLIPGNGRFYPANTPALVSLLRTSIQYVVIPTNQMSVLEPIAKEAGKKLVPIATNHSYGVYQVE